MWSGDIPRSRDIPWFLQGTIIFTGHSMYGALTYSITLSMPREPFMLRVVVCKIDHTFNMLMSFSVGISTIFIETTSKVITIVCSRRSNHDLFPFVMLTPILHQFKRLGKKCPRSLTFSNMLTTAHNLPLPVERIETY